MAFSDSWRNIKESYVYRFNSQICSECLKFGKEQLVALVIALLSAWAALHWKLVPIEQTREAYLSYLAPFALALHSIDP
jgi:hypothetical protein